MKLLYAILLYLTGQILIWFQTNGQFINDWAKDHPLAMAFFFSTPISYAFIHATRLSAEYYDGLLWPGRLVGFACGMFAFYTMTYAFLGEGLTPKTALTLLLAGTIMLIQIFL